MTDVEYLFVDDAMIVMNKPTGLLSVPGRQVPGGPDKSDCVAARVAAKYPDALIVHRLDRDTSGVMVLGRGAGPQRHLSIQFQERQTSKTYIADVALHLEADAGEVDLPIRKDMDNPPCQIVDHELGKPSLTRWSVMRRFEIDDFPVTRVELRPVTGRSHQLRMHMREIGHPVLGDDLYAPHRVRTLVDRLHLHATQLGLQHPASGESVSFACPCPF